MGRGGEREKRRKKNSRISFSVVYIQNVDLRLNQIKGIFFLLSLFSHIFHAGRRRKGGVREEEEREARRKAAVLLFYYESRPVLCCNVATSCNL